MEYWWDCSDGYTHSKLYEKMTSGTKSSLKCLYICNEVGLSSCMFDLFLLGILSSRAGLRQPYMPNGIFFISMKEISHISLVKSYFEYF